MLFAKKAASIAIAAALTFGAVNILPCQTGFGINAEAYSYLCSDKISCTFYQNYFDVSWNVVSGASKYIIMICDSNGAAVKTFAGNAGATHLLISYSGLDMTKSYYINVFGTDSSYSTSDRLPACTFDTDHLYDFSIKMEELKKYGEVRDLSAAADTSSITLTWKNPTPYTTYCNITVIDHNNKCVWSTHNYTGTTCKISGLYSGQKYNVYVENTAYGAVSEIDVTVKKPEVSSSDNKVSKDMLNAPKNLKAVRSSGKTMLKWSSVDGAKAYRVYVLNPDTRKYATYKTVASEKCVIGTLPAGTYKFRVAAAERDPKTNKYVRCGDMTAPYSLKVK